MLNPILKRASGTSTNFIVATTVPIVWIRNLPKVAASYDSFVTLSEGDAKLFVHLAMSDAELRAEKSALCREKSRTFSPEYVVRHWEKLFESIHR